MYFITSHKAAIQIQWTHNSGYKVLYSGEAIYEASGNAEVT